MRWTACIAQNILKVYIMHVEDVNVHIVADDAVYKTGENLTHTEAICLLQQRLAHVIQVMHAGNR